MTLRTLVLLALGICLWATAPSSANAQSSWSTNLAQAYLASANYYDKSANEAAARGDHRNAQAYRNAANYYRQLAAQWSAYRPPASNANRPGTTGVNPTTGQRTVNYGNVTRNGGSRSWRNNNPGNIEYGPFAIRNGAIGTDGRFAIFPNESTGHNALIVRLQTGPYQNLTVSGAISRFAPPTENNTAAYINFIRQQTGVAPNTRMNTLTPARLNAVAAAIKRVEGWIPGTTTNNTRRPVLLLP